ncbi:MAG: HAMP domain-containing sensor histidine kinase [Owenweeksia sp.]|nr:HAMP domain-containing sensor histidine kinase [Owenweeksia sp.]
MEKRSKDFSSSLVTKNRNDQLAYLAQVLSHELKAPVAGLKMLMPLLNRLEARHQAGVHENIQQASSSLFSIIDATADLLNDYRHLTEKDEHLLLMDVLHGVKSDLDEQVSNLDAHIISDFKVEEILYHPSHLIAIFTELLSNALKFCPASRRPKISIQSIIKDKWVYLNFTDNGRGFSVEESENEAFKIHQNETTGKVQKGLFRVKNLVGIHGGSIEMESKPGEGTTLFLQLYHV